MDWLITEDEEVSNSSAARFVVPEGKQYNWIVEFDRAGDDAVVYQYGDKTRGVTWVETEHGYKRIEYGGGNDSGWENALKKFGFHVGIGSYSDIRELEHLRCKAVNIGIGYLQSPSYHSRRAAIDVGMMMRQVEKFVRFYEKYESVRFGH